MSQAITKIFSFFMTMLGAIMMTKGDVTNGLLMAILGELVGLPYRIKQNNE